MPFIESKVSFPLSEEKKETIKSELGKAVSILGKSESFLMVGFEDDYDLFMGGKKLDKGAFVSVKLFGQVSSIASKQMTEKICAVFEEQLDIPGRSIYVTYQGIADWGWNGSNL